MVPLLSKVLVSFRAHEGRIEGSACPNHARSSFVWGFMSLVGPTIETGPTEGPDKA